MKATARKRYAQHFLRDTGILSRIIGLIKPSAADLVLEVGAGDGALSVRLAPKVFGLLAVEIDSALCTVLAQALAPFPNAKVIAGDILRLDVLRLLSPYLQPSMKLRIVGNLPYNIGTAIIELMLSLPIPVQDMIFMLQLETAERISAAPGSKDYGFFSVYCQHHCDTRMGFRVSPACFVPRPKVDSAMLVMRPRNVLRDPGFEASFLTVTKAAFAYRRKTLANSLRRDRRLGVLAQELLLRAGVDGARRAEDLSVQEYERLSCIYHQTTVNKAPDMRA
jgi:16S rRNA (adenine1518-N6/adenine1519-N6)-dimethyltransferase